MIPNKHLINRAASPHLSIFVREKEEYANTKRQALSSHNNKGTGFCSLPSHHSFERHTCPFPTKTVARFHCHSPASFLESEEGIACKLRKESPLHAQIEPHKCTCWMTHLRRPPTVQRRQSHALLNLQDSSNGVDVRGRRVPV